MSELTGAGCAAVRPQLPELALGSLDGAVRAEVLSHVMACPACRRDVRELTDVVDALSLLAPAVAPPDGFDTRVVRTLTSPSARPARRRRPVRPLVAAAVAALLLVGAGTAVALLLRRPDHGVTLDARSLHTVDMIGAGAEAMGSAYVSTGPSPWVLVNVRYGLDTRPYRLVGVTQDGTVVDIGRMKAIDHQWAWAGPVAQAAKLTELRVVDASGAVACRARLTL
jgi:hypothetical protein